MAEKEWLMLNFTLPKEPSRIRVSVWRKLKKFGSVNIGQSMWLLPVSTEHIAIFEDIAGEITQNGGTAYIVNADFVRTDHSQSIAGIFNAVRDEEYLEFLDKCNDFYQEIEEETAIKNFTFGELEENEEEYHKLSEWLEKIMRRDFFNAPQKGQSEQALKTCKQLLDEFSSRVYKTSEVE